MMDWTAPDARPIEAVMLKDAKGDFLGGWSAPVEAGDDPAKMAIAEFGIARVLGGLPPIELGTDVQLAPISRATQTKALTLRGEMTTRIQAGNARTSLKAVMGAMEAVLRIATAVADCPPGKVKAHIAVYDNDESGRLQAYCGITVIDGVRPNYPATIPTSLRRWMLAGALSARAAGHGERNWTEALQIPSSASARTAMRLGLAARRAEDAATIAGFLREIGLEDEARSVPDAIARLA